MTILSLIVVMSAVSCTCLADKDPPVTKYSPDVVIYRGTYPGWPWIDRTTSGRIVTVWREGTAHHYSATGKILLSASVDGGRTWSKADTIVDTPEVDDRNVAITCLTENDWLICFNSHSKDDVSRVWTCRSKDRGKSWSKCAKVCDLDARTRAAAIRLTSGELVLPMYRAPGDQSLAALSADDGDSWSVVEISNGDGFIGDEWDVAELPDGRLLGIIRNSWPNNDKKNVDPVNRGWFYETQSRDRGRTWTQPVRTNLRDTRSTSPAQVFLHHGRPVVLYADARMVSVAMAVTDDPTFVNWEVESRLHCYRYRKDDQPIVDGGYPVSVEVSDSRRLIVDYAHDGDFRAIVGYYVDLPNNWKPPGSKTEVAR
ncbi:MAG TPA: sialidase family protein [Lacipirellulaceae bacterium]|nr:sialidase family protein [Lacipirellulaceae bacterium]